MLFILAQKETISIIARPFVALPLARSVQGLLFRAQVPVVAVFAFVDGEFGGAVVVCGDLCGEFGLFLSGVADFMSITNPTALWLVGLVRV